MASLCHAAPVPPRRIRENPKSKTPHFHSSNHSYRHHSSSRYQFMHWAFFFATKPLHDALLVELAQALEPRQFVSHIVFHHADRTFLCVPVLRDAILFRRDEGQHMESCMRRSSRPRFSMVRGVSCSDAVDDVRFPNTFVAIGASRWQRPPAYRTNITFIQSRSRGMAQELLHRPGRSINPATGKIRSPKGFVSRLPAPAIRRARHVRT